MDTVLDLLLGNTLTRLVFFPAAACLPLLFFPRSAARGTRIYVLAASLVEVLFGLLYLGAHLAAYRQRSFPGLAD